MTYTPAQISAAKGGDVFALDYEDADAVQVFTFTSGSWTPYSANNVGVSSTVVPALDSDGVTSVAGSITFSVTLAHLDTFTSCHLEFDGSGITVDYTLDGGTTWTNVTEATVIPLDPAVDPDLDVRISFAGGTANDTSVLNSVTVRVFDVGQIRIASGCRVLTFGTDIIGDAGLVTTGETISATGDDLTIGSIEIRAAVGQLGVTIFNGSAFSFGTDGTGAPVVSGCTVYINGIEYTSAPSLVVSTQPYHFLIVPNVAVDEEFTLGAGLTVSNLALYQAVLASSDALTLYTSDVNGMPTITINDSSAITVTERDPNVEFFAFAWSVVSGGGQ